MHSCDLIHLPYFDLKYVVDGKEHCISLKTYAYLLCKATYVTKTQTKKRRDHD